MNDDKGTRRVLCQSEKEIEIIGEAAEYAVCKCNEVPTANLVKGVRKMFESMKTNENFKISLIV